MQTSGGKVFKADGIAWAKSPREEYAWHILETAKRLERIWKRNEGERWEVRSGRKGLAGKEL